jgi:F-type H+-transporting ATPase subunit epsilon
LKIKILSPKHVIYEGEAESIFLPGDRGEFEILSYHTPVIGLLRRGNLVIDWERSIAIRRGMVKFHNEECVVLVEE